MYNAEVAPTKFRGAVGTVSQLGITIGVLVAQILGLGNVLGTYESWPLLIGKQYQIDC